MQVKIVKIVKIIILQVIIFKAKNTANHQRQCKQLDFALTYL